MGHVGREEAKKNEPGPVLTADQVQATGDSAGDAVREGAHDVADAADTAADKVGDVLQMPDNKARLWTVRMQ